MGLIQGKTKEKQDTSKTLSLNIPSLVNNLEKVSYTKSEITLIDKSIDMIKNLSSKLGTNLYTVCPGANVGVKVNINILSSSRGQISYDFNLYIYSYNNKDILDLVCTILHMEKTLAKLGLLGHPKLVTFKLNFRNNTYMSEYFLYFQKILLYKVLSQKSSNKELVENSIFSHFISDKQGVEIQIIGQDYNLRLEKLSIITSDQPKSSKDLVKNDYSHENHIHSYPPKIKLKDFYFWIINSQEYIKVTVDQRVTSVNFPLKCLKSSIFSVEYDEFFRNEMYECYTKKEILSCFNNETENVTKCSSRVLLKMLVIEHCLDVIQSIFKYPNLQIIDLTFCTGSFLTCDKHFKSIIIVLGTLIDHFLPNIKEVNIEIIFQSIKEIDEFLTLSKNLIDILANRLFRFILKTRFITGKYLKDNYFRKEFLQETLLCCYYSKTSLLRRLKKNVLLYVWAFLRVKQDKDMSKLWN